MDGKSDKMTSPYKPFDMKEKDPAEHDENASRYDLPEKSLKEENMQSEQEALVGYEGQFEYRPMTAIEQQYEKLPESVPRRIYILGTGSIGKLIAHSLRMLPEPPPVTLLFHRQIHYEKWLTSPRTITIHRNGDDITASGFDAELVPKLLRNDGVTANPENALPKSMRVTDRSKLDETVEEEAENEDDFSTSSVLSESDRKSPKETIREKISRTADARAGVSHLPINNLIVTTKVQMTRQALEPIIHRLTPSAAVCFLQNGMGVIEHINDTLLTNAETRPVYIQGVISHGVHVPAGKGYGGDRGVYYAVHAGQGTIALGIRPPNQRPERSSSMNPVRADDNVDLGNLSSRYLIRTLTRSPVLRAVAHAPIELLKVQLEKLAVNAIINPLTALLDIENGRLFETSFAKRTMRLMLAEISVVIRNLPELRGLANIDTRFSAGQLEGLVDHVQHVTRTNISSMLADVRMSRYATEIDYINGWIIKMGELEGVRCHVNYAIMNMVKAKVRMNANLKDAENSKL